MHPFLPMFLFIPFKGTLDLGALTPTTRRHVRTISQLASATVAIPPALVARGLEPYYAHVGMGSDLTRLIRQ